MNGIRIWLWQRLSAVVVGVYFVWLLGFIVTCPKLDYVLWRGLFDNFWMRLATMMSLMALLVHSYIGIWTVLTDYLKCPKTRIMLLGSIVLLLIGCLGYGLLVIGGLKL